MNKNGSIKPVFPLLKLGKPMKFSIPRKIFSDEILASEISEMKSSMEQAAQDLIDAGASNWEVGPGMPPAIKPQPKLRPAKEAPALTKRKIILED